MYGEMFYGRHTAQHQLQWSQIKIYVSVRSRQKWEYHAPLPPPPPHTHTGIQSYVYVWLFRITNLHSFFSRNKIAIIM